MTNHSIWTTNRLQLRRYSAERVPHRKHFSFFARKNELSTFNDRYLHCDTNRVLGPKHKI